MTSAQWHETAIALQKKMRQTQSAATRAYNKYKRLQAYYSTLDPGANNYAERKAEADRKQRAAWSEYTKADNARLKAISDMRKHRARRDKVTAGEPLF